MLALNPVSPVIDGYRSVLQRGTLPDWGPLAAAVPTLLLATGWMWSHRSERTFAENV